MRQKSFPRLLKETRASAGMSVRGLAKQSGLHYAYISGLENAARACGPTSAARLATALSLDDTERAQFLLAARRTSRIPFIYDHRDFPPEILGVAASALMAHGIKPGDIRRVTTIRGKGLRTHDIAMRLDLRQHRTLLMKLDVKLIRGGRGSSIAKSTKSCE